MMRTIQMAVACVAVLVATAGQVQAELIINGGFETGDLTGWSVSGTGLASTSTNDPHTGSVRFSGWENSGFATLSQSFSTLPGAAYELDFWSFTSQSYPGNILRYQFDAGPIFTVPQTTIYALSTDSFTASGATTTLSFLFESDPGSGFWGIDDVSVTQVASVPEPSSLALFGIGACVVGAARRRRR